MMRIEQGASIVSRAAVFIFLCITTISTLCSDPRSAFVVASKDAVKAENVLSAVEKVSRTIEEVGLKVWEL